MGTVKLKPTSPGRRGAVKVLREGLFKGRPYKGLVEPKRKISKIFCIEKSSLERKIPFVKTNL